MIRKHFVTFFSPGTFVAEETTKEIESWDVEKAKCMALKIKERYSATPYGFQFFTKENDGKSLDSNITSQSPMYYLGGKVLTLDEVIARNDSKDDILISNMRSNGHDRIIINDNSWRWTQPLNDDDVVLDFKNK